MIPVSADTLSDISDKIQTEAEDAVNDTKFIFEATIVRFKNAVHRVIEVLSNLFGTECPWCAAGAESPDAETPEEPGTPEEPDTPEEPEESGEYKLEVTPTFGGSVNNASGRYDAGQIVAISAVADEGWQFVGWSSTNGGLFDDELSAQTNFTMPDSSTTVIAEFCKIGQETLTADEEAVYYAYYDTQIGYSDGDYADSVTKKLTLPTSYGEDESIVAIEWSSSNNDCIDSEGNVYRDAENDLTVVLTATFKKGEAVFEKQFTVTVIKTVDISVEEIHDNLITDLEILNIDAAYDLEIAYDDDETQVEFISGSFSEIPVDSVESALLSIYSVKSIIGLTDPENQLVWTATNHNENSVSYSFNQKHNGIEIFGVTVTVSADAESGKTLSLSSSIIEKSVLDTVDCNADLTADAVKAMFTEEDIIDCKLSIYTLNEYEANPVLVYVIETADEFIVVNADTGEQILRYETTVSFGDYSTTGEGENEQGTLVRFPVQFHWFGSNFYQEDVLRNIEIYGGNHSEQSKEFNTEWDDRTANSAYSNIIKAYDYYYNTFGRRSVNNAGKKIKIHVHNDKCRGTDNAHSHGTSGVFCFFDNASGVLPTTAAGYDIAVHEYTHNVFGNIINTKFPYENYTGAINEGYADIMAALATNDWMIGEDWRSLRNLADPESRGNPSKLSSSNYTANGEVHTNSTIVSHTAYLMSSYGISNSKLQDLWYDSMDGGYNAKSNFVTVRRNVIQAAKDNNFSDAELAKVRKAFDAVEIYDERCNLLKISIVDNENNKINLNTNNATVSLQRKKYDVPGVSHSATSNINPVEFKNIYFGEYQISVEVEGYEPFVGTISLAKDTSVTATVKLVKTGVAKVSGVVTSATTARPIENAAYVVIEGWNMTSGNVITHGITDANGKYSFEIPAGYYTMIVDKADYTTGSYNLTAEGGKELTCNPSLSPIMSDNNFRVVLRWGANPSDLDSHLFGYPENGSNYHVYYSSKTAYSNGTKIADLDVDDTTSYGPETTTFVVDATGRYEYYVDWYSGSGTWASCGGTIEVYNGDRLIAEFTAPNNSTQSGSWQVFSIENGIFKSHNVICSDIY